MRIVNNLEVRSEKIMCKITQDEKIIIENASKERGFKNLSQFIRHCINEELKRGNNND